MASIASWLGQPSQYSSIYTLQYTVEGEGIVAVPLGVDVVAFAAVTMQQLENANNLVLAVQAGLILYTLSWEKVVWDFIRLPQHLT